MDIKIEWNGHKATLLSWTTGMDCWSFSLPAGFACPLAKYGHGMVCNSCYAMMNRYANSNVLSAQTIRLHWAKENLDNGVFVETMTHAIRTMEPNKYFRGHDSGDFFSKPYLRAWQQICFDVPETEFWFPTRNWQDAEWLDELEALDALPNVVVRASALAFDEPGPTCMESASQVVTNPENATHQMCAKSMNGGSCESNGCRTCWTKGGVIAYWVHTYQGRHKPSQVSDKIKNHRRSIYRELITV